MHNVKKKTAIFTRYYKLRTFIASLPHSTHEMYINVKCIKWNRLQVSTLRVTDSIQFSLSSVAIQHLRTIFASVTSYIYFAGPSHLMATLFGYLIAATSFMLGSSMSRACNLDAETISWTFTIGDPGPTAVLGHIIILLYYVSIISYNSPTQPQVRTTSQGANKNILDYKTIQSRCNVRSFQL